MKQNKTHASENCSADSSYQIESVPPTAVSDQLVFKFRLSQKLGELHIVEPTQLKIDHSELLYGPSKRVHFPLKKKHCQRHNGPRILSPKLELSLKGETNANSNLAL